MKSLHYVFSPQGTSITLIIDGIPKIIPNDDPRFDSIVNALRERDYQAVAHKALVELPKALAQFGAVSIYGGHVVANGEELHGFLVDTIIKAVEQGLPLEPLGMFQANVLENPDPRARADLYEFCAKSGLPITDDGQIIAYKIIAENYHDIYSGTVDHSVGLTVSMPRDQCDPDPGKTCSTGLHFCSAAYLPHYGTGKGSRIVLVKVHPRDVTAFPTDYNNAKARCCQYQVVQEIDRETAPDFFKGVVFWSAAKDKYVLFSPNEGSFWKARWKGYTKNPLEAHVYSDDEIDEIDYKDFVKINVATDAVFLVQHDSDPITLDEARNGGWPYAILVADPCS